MAERIALILSPPTTGEANYQAHRGIFGAIQTITRNLGSMEEVGADKSRRESKGHLLALRFWYENMSKLTVRQSKQPWRN